MNASPDTVSPVTERPWPLRLAVILLSVQALALVGVAVLLAILSLTQPQTSTGAGLVEGFTALVVGGLLAAAAWSLHRKRSGLVGIAVFLELMTLPLGYYLAAAGLWWFALLAWALGVSTMVLMLAPSVRGATGMR